MKILLRYINRYDYNNMMIEIFDENYFIDIDKVQEIISLPGTVSGDSEQNMSIVKFELVKTMIDVIMSENEVVDTTLGAHSVKDMSLPFKFAFNTLFANKIITKF